MTIPKHKAYSSSTENFTIDVNVKQGGGNPTAPLPILTLEGDMALGTASSSQSFVDLLFNARYTPDDIWSPAAKDEPELWRVWVDCAWRDEAIQGYSNGTRDRGVA